MAFPVVLDANVLVPAPLRDTLLRFAEAEFYEPMWSERILAELEKNLVVSVRTDAQRAKRVADQIREIFPEALVATQLIETIEPAMTNDPKDRHVLAAAIASNAQIIVTHNLKDFPTHACKPLGTEAISPDDFLLDLYQLDPSSAMQVIAEQAKALNNPPMTPVEVLGHLSRDAPAFARTLRAASVR